MNAAERLPSPTGEPAAEWVAIDALRPCKDNPRKNDGEPVRKVAESIQRFGFGAQTLLRRDSSWYAYAMTLDAAEREALLSELASIARGGDRLITAPLVLPISAHFPDALDDGPEGVRTLMRRLLVYAGFPEMRVRVDDYRDVSGFGAGAITPPEVEVHSIGDDVVCLDWQGDGIGEWFVYALTQAVGHVLVDRAARGMNEEVRHPYRGARKAPRADKSVQAREERLASLHAMLCGFGVLIANGTDLFSATHLSRHHVVRARMSGGGPRAGGSVVHLGRSARHPGFGRRTRAGAGCPRVGASSRGEGVSAGALARAGFSPGSLRP